MRPPVFETFSFDFSIFRVNLMKVSIVRFLRDEEGATAVEYGVIAGLMATALLAIFGDGTGTLIGKLKAALNAISFS